MSTDLGKRVNLSARIVEGVAIAVVETVFKGKLGVGDTVKFISDRLVDKGANLITPNMGRNM